MFQARIEVPTQLGTRELYCVLSSAFVYSNYACCVHVVFLKMVEDAKYERPLADKTLKLGEWTEASIHTLPELHKLTVSKLLHEELVRVISRVESTSSARLHPGVLISPPVLGNTFH